MTLSEEAIRAELSAQMSEKIKLHLYRTTDSTNIRSKEFAKSCSEDEKKYIHIFIAEEQTAGRGRLGKSFDSKGGCGLYMSILNHRNVFAADGVAITAYTAVAVCRALCRMTPLSPRIKWVNDIYIGRKKLCGILVEGSADPTTGKLRYSVTGIGLNLLRRDFGELSDIATDIESECGTALPVSRVAAEIAREFISKLDTAGTAECVAEYRRLSMLVGERVRVIKPSGAYPGTVLGITDKCELLIVRDDGTEEALSSGEVSLKLN